MNKKLIVDFINEVKRSVDKPYDHDMLDDENFNKESQIIPNSSKKKIARWMKDMGLAHR